MEPLKSPNPLKSSTKKFDIRPFEASERVNSPFERNEVK